MSENHDDAGAICAISIYGQQELVKLQAEEHVFKPLGEMGLSSVCVREYTAAERFQKSGSVLSALRTR